MSIRKWVGGIILIGIGIFVMIFLIEVGRIFHPTQKIIHNGHGAVGTTTYEPGTLKNLCDYVLLKEFRWRVSMEEGRGASVQRMGLQIFTRSNSAQQMISLIRWPYHLKVDPEDILLEEEELKRTWLFTGQEIKNYFETVFHRTDKEDLFYTIYYYIPFFYNLNIPPQNRSLILRGLKLKDQRYLETSRARIWVWYGDFKRIAFDKRQDHWLKHYIREVIEFEEPKTGAVALIQNKDPNAKAQYIEYTNEAWTEFKTIGEVPMDLKEATLFAITTVRAGESFDQEEFEMFLKTIDFRAYLYDPNVIDERDIEEFNKKHPDFKIRHQIK